MQKDLRVRPGIVGAKRPLYKQDSFARISVKLRFYKRSQRLFTDIKRDNKEKIDAIRY